MPEWARHSPFVTGAEDTCVKSFDEIDETVLQRCAMRIRPWTAPGIDDITRDEFRLSDGISILARQLREGTYLPASSRRGFIRKADGTRRPIAVPTIRDRVVQIAIVGVLSDRYEPSFSDVSFGARRARNANRAVRRVRRALDSIGTPCVAEFDIEKFFDRVRHEDVLARLVDDDVDARIVRLVNAFLTAPVVDAGRASIPTVGTPQGGPLSPLLANLILDRALDAWFPLTAREHRWGDPVLVRYLDDFVVVLPDLSLAREVIAQVGRRLESFGLQLNRKKTSATAIQPPDSGEHGGKFDFLGWTIRYEKHALGPRLVQRTSLKSMRRSLQRVKEKMRKMKWQQMTAAQRRDWYHSVIRGHREYFYVPENEEQVWHFEAEFHRLFQAAEARLRSRRRR